MNRHFAKEDIQMAHKHMKRFSTSLSFRETQVKTTMRYHFTSIRMATKNKTQNNLPAPKPENTVSAGKDVEKSKLLCVVGRNAKWCSHYGKQYGRSSKN